MSTCSIGTVDLHEELLCPELWLPDYKYKPIAYAYGGGNISISPVLHNLTLTSELQNNIWSGWYTIEQVYLLRGLEDIPHQLAHPMATKLGITGITVFVNKASVAELKAIAPAATPSAPAIDGRYDGSGDPYLYYGSISLERLT